MSEGLELHFLEVNQLFLTDMNNQGTHVKNSTEKWIKCYVHFQCERDLETIKPEELLPLPFYSLLLPQPQHRAIESIKFFK